MKIIAIIFVLGVITVFGESQSTHHQVVENEAWILQPKEPTQEERSREETTRWMLETSSRHWSGEGEMTPQELNKLRSIYQNEDGKQKVDAFSIITFVEEIGNWEGDLVEMLYSNKQAYVQSALNVLSAKLQKGDKHEKSVLANNQAIASRLEELESLWVDNINIQSMVRKARLGLADLELIGGSEEALAEIPSDHLSPEVAEEAQESTAREPATEKPTEVVTTEPSQEPAEKSSNWWLWLIGALVVLGVVGLAFRRKS